MYQKQQHQSLSLIRAVLFWSRLQFARKSFRLEIMQTPEWGSPAALSHARRLKPAHGTAAKRRFFATLLMNACRLVVRLPAVKTGIRPDCV
jgi:hypothetical protein